MGSCCFKSNKIHVDEEIKVHTISNDNRAHHHHWDYENCANWSNEYPNARGKHQSPVNIVTSKALYSDELAGSPIMFNLDPASFTEIKNNGHSFVVSGKSEKSYVSQGTISYRFAQFHMHWGSADSTGSEHSVDGKLYSAELHFVCWNYGKFKEVNEALNSNNHDGLMVLGVLIEIGEENSEFNKIIECLKDIKLKDSTRQLSQPIDCKNLFPVDMSKFWSYSGSLTTPPCSESVKWIVFYNTITLSSNQLNEFRKLHCCSDASECNDSTRMKKNWRPVCELNDRKLYKSFN